MIKVWHKNVPSILLGGWRQRPRKMKIKIRLEMSLLVIIRYLPAQYNIFVPWPSTACSARSTYCLQNQELKFFTVIPYAKILYRKLETNIPRMKLRGLVPYSYIHASVSDLYIPTIGLPIWLQQNRWNEGAQFHFWIYLNPILFAV